MDRRDFIANLFTILPAATSYRRIWKEITKQPNWVLGETKTFRLNPEYVKANGRIYFLMAADWDQPISIGPPPEIKIFKPDEWKGMWE